MKNSKVYSKKIQSLYRTLKRKYPKVHEINHETVADTVVYDVELHGICVMWLSNKLGS